ncbi:tetratricopeptide repeat protein [Mucilaginibacter terrae]|uniref:tetratricopeptide repeat protein n=1 Tax=Mucilaginibacter terrae TaxID=1955052 RepID=UPI00364010D2
MSVLATAQTPESIYNKYTDFNLARLQGERTKSITLGQTLLPDAGKLPEKNRIGFYNSLAKLYEDNKQLDLARPLYEKVVAAVPDYYVVHLALGHIYMNDANALAVKVNDAKGDKAAYQQSRTAYIAAVNKVLMHLEKVQACDPYDDNLNLIKKLYTSIGNPAGFAGLESRLKPMRAKCLDILDEN